MPLKHLQMGVYKHLIFNSVDNVEEGPCELLYSKWYMGVCGVCV